jgi:hypothetical protein
MQIKDAQAIRLVERIGEHYRTNISNRFIRPALLQLAINRQTWDQIEILCEKPEQYLYQGFDLVELYRQVAAAAKFISLTRRELAPNLRIRLSKMGVTGSDRILRDMAINNFSPNLTVFAELVGELYTLLTELDKADARGRKPVFRQMGELENIDQLLGKADPGGF